jgi:hypothetical protein
MKPTLLKLAPKSLLIPLFSMLFFTKANAQHFNFGNDKIKIEAGLNFGPTFFLGDLGGNQGKGTSFIKDVNLELTTFMKGAFIAVYPNDWMGLRLAGQFTYLAGQDKLVDAHGGDELYRKQRNLDFKSKIWEVYGAVELFPTMMFNLYNDYEPRLKPYGFVGLGVFHFDPMGSLTSSNGVQTWYRLQPLLTEGQGMAEYPGRKPYKLTQINIPLGGGIKYALSERINVGFELLYRKTFTDYIDDVSTNYIDPKYFDQYLSPSDAVIARNISDKAFGIITPGLTRYAPGIQRGNVKNKDAYILYALEIWCKIRCGVLQPGSQECRPSNKMSSFLLIAKKPKNEKHKFYTLNVQSYCVYDLYDVVDVFL